MRITTITLFAVLSLSAGGMAILADQAQPEKRTDEERILGTWRLVKGQFNGEVIAPDLALGSRLTFSKSGALETGVIGAGDWKKDGNYKIVGPGKIDVGERDLIGPGIYKFDGDDKLMICFPRGKDATRPEKYESAIDSFNYLLVLERAKADEKLTPEEMAKVKAAIENESMAAALENAQQDLLRLAGTMNLYHDQKNGLPTHAIYSKDGKTPLLSWRVALLTYINPDLYDQFKLDEPWDSEHNKKLVAKMPRDYEARVPGRRKEGMTYYQVFTGPDTPFDGNKKRKFGQITDGTSNTIMIIEAKEPVIWTKPADLELPKDKTKLPELGGVFPDLMNFVMCENSVRSAHNVQDAAILRPLITPSAGDLADVEKLKGVK